MPGLSGLSNHSCERRRGLLVIGVLPRCCWVSSLSRLRGGWREAPGGVTQARLCGGKSPHPTSLRSATLPEDGERLKGGCGHAQLPCLMGNRAQRRGGNRPDLRLCQYVIGNSVPGLP